MKANLAMMIDPENLPTPKAERWKYTNLPAALRHLGVVPAVPYLIEWDGPKEIVLAAGERAAAPIIIRVHAIPSGMAAPKLSMKLAAGAEATVIEYHSGDGAFWNNAATTVELAAGARLHHYRLQEYGAKTVYTQMTHVTLDRDAHYEAFTLTTGAALSRNQIQLDLLEPGGVCHLNGVSLLSGEQVGDTTLTIRHAAPHCTSHQFYRTVLDVRARGVFQGKIHVERSAQKTDGYQMSRALILSEGAEMNTKPELEIYADDVKCSHGATTGQLDEEALFYLRSRGIGRDEARGLLIGAFIDEAVQTISQDAAREAVAQRVSAWLQR